MKGSSGPPADLRFLARSKSQITGDSASAKVTSYLQTIYDSVAETLPDVRDDLGVETKLDENWNRDGMDQSYATLKLAAVSSLPVKKRARRYKQGLKLHAERQPDISGLEVRYLPPGNMSEYWEQFCNSEGAVIVSFPVFWRVWRTEFAHLRFRPTSSHAQCASCLHHKLLLRELSPWIHARKRQAALYNAHLLHQYRDRQIYWSLRGSSRLRVLGHICLIQDGMDQAAACPKGKRTLLLCYMF